VFATKACEAMGVGSRDRPHTLWGEGEKCSNKNKDRSHVQVLSVCLCWSPHCTPTLQPRGGGISVSATVGPHWLWVTSLKKTQLCREERACVRGPHGLPARAWSCRTAPEL
jgi:hypothetical protein